MLYNEPNNNPETCMRKIKGIIAVLLLFFSITLAAAQIIHPTFNSVEANNVLSQVNAVKVEADANTLKALILNLNKYSVEAKNCIDDSNNELAGINEDLNSITTTHTQGKALSAEQKYLNNKKTLLTNQLSECHLFLLKATEANTELNNRLRAVLKSELLYADFSFVENLNSIPQQIYLFFRSLDINPIFASSGLAQLNLSKIITLLVAIFLGAGIALYLKKYLKQLIGTQTAATLLLRLKQNLLAVLNKNILWLIPLTLFSALFTIFFIRQSPIPFLVPISYFVLAYLVFMMVMEFIFHPPKPARAVSDIPENLAKSLLFRINGLAIICLIGFAVAIMFAQQNIAPSIHYLFWTIFITLTSIQFIAVIWLIKRLPKIVYHYPFLRSILTFIFSLLLIVILFSEWMGFHLLSTYLLRGTIISMLVIFAAILLMKIINLPLNSFSEAPFEWQQKFKKRLGLHRHQRFPEAIWLRMVLYALMWCVVFMMLLKIWGLAPANFQLLGDKLLHGFQIGQLHIVPSRIAVGLLLFIFLLVLTRTIRSYFAKNTNTQLDQGNREALAAIVGYIGIVLTTLLALLIAGVSFAGLAIVAGALSVGIGFGLQNIVSNFIAGLILLIERPIKPGDRIIVNDTEGYVRRISIRSTHVITLRRTDVIVPNSDLVSKPVTNYMLYDTNFMLVIPIGLEYDSDTELAKKLLIKIASEHSKIISNIEGQEPAVFFNKFGENSLDLELWCLVSDVKIKGSVTSDLHFRIQQEFNKHGIKIAFPQREVTIKQMPNLKEP